ncbi:MAG TPA: hypothetical protein IAA60_01565 [Candidatus Ornithomonoglobus intestinigallinarum]|jgi:cytochrome bd-type quinol oxidase subunit 2|uniref:Uncharacterized protein n=1 Tax=Candidatus Ornithomonoglobus intestinigallinarum TaxID=2840894 RepID=A0A9D1KQ23_9FIRM|nr:hypothetical protein [Candidatus Ornithomonoglobus intestinigallinarum]
MDPLNSKIAGMLKKTAPRLVFALICGLAYFVIVMRFVSAYTSHAALMAMFIAPAVICGGAYIVIVILKRAFENEGRGIAATFYMNLFIILTAALIAAASAAGAL